MATWVIKITNIWWVSTVEEDILLQWRETEVKNKKINNSTNNAVGKGEEKYISEIISKNLTSKKNHSPYQKNQF
jgi:hypothetical protein